MATVSRIMSGMEENQDRLVFALLLCGARAEGVYLRDKLVVGPGYTDGGNIAAGDWFSATRNRTAVIHDLNDVFTSWLRVYLVNPVTGYFAEPVGFAVAELMNRLPVPGSWQKHAMGPGHSPLCGALAQPVSAALHQASMVRCPRCLHLMKMREFFP